MGTCDHSDNIPTFLVESQCECISTGTSLEVKCDLSDLVRFSMIELFKWFGVWTLLQESRGSCFRMLPR